MSEPGTGIQVETQESTDTELVPPYKVILHNDDVNDMVRVVDVILRLTPLGREEAIQKMFEAHYTGYAVLLVTHKERAELYAEQFASCRLTVTIEPDV
jgi:ATP-dependent Clp protease adaptor protein ClpS